MYKLLIVDDEALVRDAIKEQMNWEQLGFECIGDCEDGLEALEFIKHNKPDVVLTDIGMPFMNGIELTRELALNEPKVKVIILTGYDDFDFAQQALKLQAADYILKPVTSAELEVIIRRVGSELDVERRKSHDNELLKQQLTDNLPLLKEMFLERLVTSKMTRKQLEERSSYFQIKWNGPLVIELAIDVDEFSISEPSTLFDQDLLRFGVFNIAQEITAKYSGTAIFRDRENHVLILLSGEDSEYLQELAMLAAEEIHHAVTSYLCIKISIGIGNTSSREENASLAHRSALSALEYRFVIGINEIIRISDMEQRQRPELFSVVSWESELITKLKTCSAQDMNDWMMKLFATFREHVFPIDVCYIYLHRIVLTIVHTLYEIDSNSSQVCGEAKNLILEMNRFSTLDEIEDWMKQFCEKVVVIIQSMREDQSARQITMAIDYVKQHYMKPELSLKSVCKYVSMSSSYFSTLFKQYSGRSFVEFVTNERIEKAKELLNLTSMKSYEIAYAVGYSDPHYFSGAFKKHTGDTPTEFRTKMNLQKV